MEDLFRIYKNRHEIDSVVLEDEAKTANLITLQKAIDSYYEEMKGLLEDKRTFLNDSFELHHLKIKTEKLTQVRRTHIFHRQISLKPCFPQISMKIIGEPNIKKYQEKLESHLSSMFTVFEKSYNNKHKQFLKETEARNLGLMSRSREIYSRNMHEALTRKGNMSLEELRRDHIRNRKEAVEFFESSRDACDWSFEKYMCSLNDSIDEFYTFLQSQCTNNSFNRWNNIKDMLKMTLEFSMKILEVLMFFRGRIR